MASIIFPQNKKEEKKNSSLSYSRQEQVKKKNKFDEEGVIFWDMWSVAKGSLGRSSA